MTTLSANVDPRDRATVFRRAVEYRGTGVRKPLKTRTKDSHIRHKTMNTHAPVMSPATIAAVLSS